MATAAIAQEYARWTVARRALTTLLAQIRVDPRGAHNADYEARAIFERAAISLYNFGGGGDGADDAAATAICEKMASELVDKHLLAAPGAAAVSRDVCARLREARDAPSAQPAATARVVVLADAGMVKYSMFAARIAPDRLKMLLARADAPAVAQMLMRYDAISPGGQQWAAPRAVYEAVITHIARDGDWRVIEAFASPINSLILPMMPPRGDAAAARYAFCSLFLDVDAPFGSIGSFFEVDLRAEKSQRTNIIIANPPFIIDMMDATVRHCGALLDDAAAATPLRIVVIVPSWRDAAFLAALFASAHLEQAIELPARRAHFVGDGGRAQILASFGVSLFILANAAARASAPLAPRAIDEIARAF